MPARAKSGSTSFGQKAEDGNGGNVQVRARDGSFRGKGRAGLGHRLGRATWNHIAVLGCRGTRRQVIWSRANIGSVSESR